MTFYPPPPHFCKKAQWVAKKQNFCKKAQWVAKKLRERGSNAGRRPKKGGGGPPDSVAIGRNRSQSVAIGRAETEDKAPKKSRLVAIGRNRSRLVAPKQKTRRKHKKSPIPQSGIGLHNVARRRALLAFNELLAQIHMQALEAFC